MDAATRIGTTLKGKWRIDRLLGTGGFASVYAATHRAGKRVAIKVLHAALGASEEVRRRFLKEAYAANAVGHPGVVGVSDDDVTEDGAPFLVMDLLEGETVEARRKKAGGKLDVRGALFVAEEALGALAAAHAKGIVHRDLKPENLFMTDDGQVKILDFGIARFREPGDESTATQTGLTMGSPAFMAPEQARGRWSEVDARSDVYSMGATMFVLLSGRLVHGRRSLNEALIEAATRPAPPLSSVAPDVPEAVAAVVDRALAFEREQRWADAGAMREAVREAKSALAAATSSLGGATGTVPLGPVPAASPGGPPTRPDVGALFAAGATTFGGSSAPSTATAPLPPMTGAPGGTEIPRAGALPIPPVPTSSHVVTTGAPTTSAPVVTTAAPVRKSRTAPVVGASLVAVLGLGGVLAWIATRDAAEPGVSSAAPPRTTASTDTSSSAPSEPVGSPGTTGSPAAPVAAEPSSTASIPATPAAPKTAGAGTSKPKASTGSAGVTKPQPSTSPTPSMGSPGGPTGDDLRNTPKRK